MNYNEYLRNGFASILQEAANGETRDKLYDQFKEDGGNEDTTFKDTCVAWAKKRPADLSYILAYTGSTLIAFCKAFSVPRGDLVAMTKGNVSLAGYLILKYALRQNPKTQEDVKEWLDKNSIRYRAGDPGFLSAPSADALNGGNGAEETGEAGEKTNGESSSSMGDLVNDIKTAIQNMADSADDEEKDRFNVVIGHISGLTTAKEIFEKILDLYKQYSGSELSQDVLVCSKILVKVWEEFGNQLVAEGVKKDDTLSNILIADEALKIITENNKNLADFPEEITSEDYAYLSSLVEERGNLKTVNGYSYDYYKNRYSNKNDIVYYKFVAVDLNKDKDSLCEDIKLQADELRDLQDQVEAIKGKSFGNSDQVKQKLQVQLNEYNEESKKTSEDLISNLKNYGIPLSGEVLGTIRKLIVSLATNEKAEMENFITELDTAGYEELYKHIGKSQLLSNDPKRNPLYLSDEEIWARGINAYVQAAILSKQTISQLKKLGYKTTTLDDVLTSASKIGLIGTALISLTPIGQLAIAPFLLFSTKLLITVPGCILGAKGAVSQWKAGNKLAALGCAAGSILAASGAANALQGWDKAVAGGLSPKDALLRMASGIFSQGIEVGDTPVSPEEIGTIMADQKQALLNGGMSEEQADNIIKSQLGEGMSEGAREYNEDQSNLNSARDISDSSTIGGPSEDTSSSNGPLNPNGVEPTGNTVENTHAAVANAQPGDMITRDDGTKVILSQGDIDYEKNFIAGNTDSANEAANPTVADTEVPPNNGSADSQSLGGGSSGSEGDSQGEQANPTSSPTANPAEGAVTGQVDSELLLKQGNTDELFRGFNTEQMPSESEMEAFATVDPETGEKSYDIPQNELSYFEKEYLKNLGATGSSTEYVDANGNPQLNDDGSPRYLSAIHATQEQVDAAREAQSIIGRTFDADSPNRITNVTELQDALQDAAKQNGATLTGNCKTIIDKMMSGFNGENASTFTGMDTQSNRTILKSLQDLAGNGDWGTDRVGAEFNADNFKLRSPYINNGS